MTILTSLIRHDKVFALTGDMDMVDSTKTHLLDPIRVQLDHFLFRSYVPESSVGRKTSLFTPTAPCPTENTADTSLSPPCQLGTSLTSSPFPTCWCWYESVLQSFQISLNISPTFGALCFDSNPCLQGAAVMLEDLPYAVRLLISATFKTFQEGPFLTKTVEELMWGYDSKLVEFLNKYLPGMLPSTGKFGLFAEVNINVVLKQK